MVLLTGSAVETTWVVDGPIASFFFPSRTDGSRAARRSPTRLAPQRPPRGPPVPELDDVATPLRPAPGAARSSAADPASVAPTTPTLPAATRRAGRRSETHRSPTRHKPLPLGNRRTTSARTASAAPWRVRNPPAALPELRLAAYVPF